MIPPTPPDANPERRLGSELPPPVIRVYRQAAAVVAEERSEGERMAEHAAKASDPVPGAAKVAQT